MLSMMHSLFCLLGLLHCAVDGFVVGERNADARVSTVYHFPNNTVSLLSTGPCLTFVKFLLTTHIPVGREHSSAIQRKACGDFGQCAPSLADRPNHSFRRACARVRKCRRRTRDRRV
jgi:hypothetical protein